MKPIYARRLALAAITACLALGNGSEWIVPAIAGQQVEKRWIVMFRQQGSVPDDAAAIVTAAGGSILALLPEVGALVARSSNANFAAAAAREPKVADVLEDVPLRMIPARERLWPEVLTDAHVAAAAGAAEPVGADTQTGPDGFYNLFQWDKKRMRASNQGSYAVQQGRPDLVVAVLDSGADVLPVPHVDIANPATGTNFDAARSRAFFPVQANPNGDPNPAAWDDKHGHGSWCLSAIGAPINGIGMVGVAPKVRLVALKVLGDDGNGSFVSVAQALIYAANNKFDVASMSIGAY
jgi:subtilisin family serine protease